MGNNFFSHVVNLKNHAETVLMNAASIIQGVAVPEQGASKVAAESEPPGEDRASSRASSISGTSSHSSAARVQLVLDLSKKKAQQQSLQEKEKIIQDRRQL